ncbi:uncharacterized protein [Misgurnus anguillicaudatus]|uniref:uncharacterized protein n=1 Tax=Misgurnus anguillicaudatus TaxID=75329 RepID=UPI0024355247|nr:uncharacterized protein LOC129444282 [Misgurnus anguillicaudatus]
MFRPVTPLSEKDMEGTDVESMDEEYDEEMVDVYPTLTEAKRQRVLGGEMDSFLPNAVLTYDYVPDIGLALEVGRAAGGLDPNGGGEQKIPTMLGWRCDDGGMDLVLPNAVPDIVPNNGHLLDRRAGSSHPRGGVKEFTPAFEEANSPKEKCTNKVLKSIKKTWKNVMHPFLRNDKVETLIPSELNAVSANPNLKDDAGLASSELNTEMKPDKRKAFFGCPWRGKVESMPTPQLKADPAIPDVREVVDLASQSKADVSPKKQKQKASKSRKSNLQGEKVTVVPTQQPKAISDIPVGMDVPALASPQSKTKIHPDKSKTLMQCILGCFGRGKVESMPISQIEADPAIPDVREVIDLADSQSKSVGLKKNKQKASKSRFFHNPWRKKGKSKVKKDADPAIPDAMDGADLASFGGIAAANARLQQIGAVPANIGLKGGGNPDPKKAPGSKDEKAVRPKVFGNLRHPWIHNPSRTKNPGPKEDKNPRPKALENPRNQWPEDDKVVRPKDKNVFQRPIQALSEMKFDEPSEQETFHYKYQLLENKVLGRGGCGKVCKGIRKWDGTLVAIKRIRKQKNERTLQIPGYAGPLITEVALLLKLKDAPHCPNVIELFDFYETRQFHNLVLHYPLQSKTLRRFVTRERKLNENTARILMHQAVMAVKHCLDNGVFHTDLHARNFLVQESTMDLKLIDFGLGHLLKYKGYKSCEFKGARCCTPPEIQTANTFHAMPANVWALGALLHFMVLGTYPFPHNKFSLDNLKKKGLSKDICDLLRWCLAMNPSNRPTLRQILDHDWF